MSASKAEVLAGLRAERELLNVIPTKRLFTDDPKRMDVFSRDACGLHVDFSKHRLRRSTLDLLLSWEDACGVGALRDKMFAGAEINESEDRAVLHTALRDQAQSPLSPGHARVMNEVMTVRANMRAFVTRLEAGQFAPSHAPIETVIHVGIGGSELGPKLLVDALPPRQNAPVTRFLANLDGTEYERAIAGADPRSTLVIAASKSFTTWETKANVEKLWAWLKAGGIDNPGAHIVALTAKPELAAKLGVPGEQIFPLWDWVGGRYSLWSAIGLPFAVHAGWDAFCELLQGAREMDEHFLTADAEHNLPILLGLIGAWYIHFHGAETQAVFAYDHRLAKLPSFLQQLDMESNGKGITKAGDPVEGSTGPIIWGGEGTLVQHAVMQLMHQSPRLVPADFIIARDPRHDHIDHHQGLIANCLAQSAALMNGRSLEETIALYPELAERPEIAAQRTYPGNKPSSTIVLDAFTPHHIGALLALYEHKVLVQSALWEINAFDQWGVELGKLAANDVHAALVSKGEATDFDRSTNALIAKLRRS
ncbi:MAG: glucose-6-phosphate isomerase [Pseudomonadota bacterium]